MFCKCHRVPFPSDCRIVSRCVLLLFFPELPLSLTPRGRKGSQSLLSPARPWNSGQHVKGSMHTVMHPGKHPCIQQDSNAAVILATLIRDKEDFACNFWSMLRGNKRGPQPSASSPQLSSDSYRNKKWLVRVKKSQVVWKTNRCSLQSFHLQHGHFVLSSRSLGENFISKSG